MFERYLEMELGEELLTAIILVRGSNKFLA
jgi:hypothetical protein